MQNIRSVGTTPERIVERALKRKGVYFSRHVTSIVGKPDIVFRKKKVAVFIDSDFWHGHPKRCTVPKSNIYYWKKKIQRNRERDKEVNKLLKKRGWKVCRVWEYDIKHRVEKSICKILKALQTNMA